MTKTLPTPTSFKPLLIVGIDHDVEKHGVTIYDEKINSWLSESMTTHGLITYLHGVDTKGCQLVISIEASWEVKQFYGYQHKKKLSQGGAMKLGMNVMQNHISGKTLYECLRGIFGESVTAIKPIQKKVFKPDGKWNANTRNYFKQCFPQSKATNDDERDSELIARHTLTNCLLDRHSRKYRV